MFDSFNFKIASSSSALVMAESRETAKGRQLSDTYKWNKYGMYTYLHMYVYIHMYIHVHVPQPTNGT